MNIQASAVLLEASRIASPSFYSIFSALPFPLLFPRQQSLYITCMLLRSGSELCKPLISHQGLLD